MFSLTNVHIAIKQREIISNVSATFRQGELTALIGPNGAGKSTLIKTLAGVIPTSKGEVQYFGKNLKTYKSEELAKVRAYLNQQVNAAFDFSVKEVVMLGRHPFYEFSPTASDKAMVDLAMQKNGVFHLKDAMIKTLSGGELQRVHFARTLAQVWGNEQQKGKLLLLDEPVNNLDPKYQHTILQLAKEEAVINNTAVVVVLHDLNLAAQYADRTVAMCRGKIVKDAKTEEVLTAKILGDLYGIAVSQVQVNGQLHVLMGKGCGECQENLISTYINSYV